MTEDVANVDPLVVRLERDGAGSASFDWDQVLSTLCRSLGGRVADVIGKDVSVVGVRFLDADGRDLRGPAPLGITVVGFETRGTS